MRALIVICLFFSSLSAFDATIPVLHLPDYFNQHKRSSFLEKLDQALRENGFFALTGTGVDPTLLDLSYEQIKLFFDQDMILKEKLKTRDGQRGYSSKESAKYEARIDHKEFFHIGRDRTFFPPTSFSSNHNLWPKDPVDFKPYMESLYEVMDSYKIIVGEILSTVLGLDLTFLNRFTQDADCILRAIHYPANPPTDAIWAGAHTDINLFTILPRSTAPGLQLFTKEGMWVDVIVPDGAFIVNCGDMLENLTNGYCKSSLHRVIDKGINEDRYSAVFFTQTKAKDRLDPVPSLIEKTGGKRLYANVTGQELLSERLIDLGRAPIELMSSFVESGAIERLNEVGRFSPKAKLLLNEAGFRVD